MQANGRTGLIKHLGGSSDPHFVAGYAPIRPNRVDSLCLVMLFSDNQLSDNFAHYP